MKTGRKKRLGVILSLLAVLLPISALFGGCGSETDTGSVVMVEQEREEITYEMAVAVIGDVEKTQSIKCTYQQMKDEDVSFDISGKQIAEVYVKEGDHVEKGQLLAELTGGNLDQEIRTLEYRIARNKLLLEHAEVNENYDISTRWLYFIYQSGHSQAEKEMLEDTVENIQKNYRYVREDCQDAITLDEARLEALQMELAQSRVYAGMTGTVTWLKDGLEGSTCAKGEKIMTIIDSSECFFVTEKEECAQYFTEGQKVQLSITSGTGAGKYTVIPYEMDQWGEKQMFVLTEDGENSIIEVGAMGSLTVVMERREQVLSIPVSAVHTADGKDYVYVVGENNMREMKWIETGLYGNNSVEVISGLSRGEKVIIK